MDDQSPVNIVDGQAPYSGRFDMSHPSVGDNPLAVFNGEKAFGTWTLHVTDWYDGDTGSLNAWGIEFVGDLGDRFEPNDDYSEAVNFGVLGTAIEDDLSIHTSLDTDFFRFSPASDGVATIEIYFEQAAGDLTLQLIDSSLTVIAEGATATDNELIVADVEAAETYYIKVLGVNGALNRYDLSASVAPEVPGDFNDDHVVDASDIDLLRGGIQTGLHEPLFDLTGDGFVDGADMDELILNVLDTLYGDATLDHAVDGLDFLAWNANKFTSGGWAQGNFNLDNVVDGLVFLAWNNNKFQSTLGLWERPAISRPTVAWQTMNPVPADRPASAVDRAFEAMLVSPPPRRSLAPPPAHRAAASGEQPGDRTARHAEWFEAWQHPVNDVHVESLAER